MTGSTRRNGNKMDIRGLACFMLLNSCEVCLSARMMDMAVAVSVDNEKLTDYCRLDNWLLSRKALVRVEPLGNIRNFFRG
jgi:hypothetical protein